MDLSVALSLITTVAVVSGVLFAGVQVRHARLQRAREAELLLARSFQTPEFMQAMFTAMHLPDGISREDLDALGAAVGAHVNLWQGSMESLGILVHHRELSMGLVEDFFSGPIVISWRKLRRSTEETRQAFGRDTMSEWFQWLAERIEEREAGRAPAPANIEFADWHE